MQVWRWRWRILGYYIRFKLETTRCYVHCLIGGSILSNTSNGEGGYSFVDTTRTMPDFIKYYPGYNRVGHGYVLIVPAIPGCDCDYRCLALDERRAQVTCICPSNWRLDIDGKSCKRKRTLYFVVPS